MTQSVWIGNNTYINGDLIISISAAKNPQMKRLAKDAKENGRLLDYTSGEAKKSAILFNDGRVILSIIEPQDIIEEIKKEAPNE